MFRYLFTVWVFWMEMIQNRRDKPQGSPDFDAWFAEHKKSCKNCANPDNALCFKAFRTLKQMLRQAKKAK